MTDRRTAPFTDDDLPPDAPTGAMPAARTSPFVQEPVGEPALAPSAPTETFAAAALPGAGPPGAEEVAGFRLMRKLGEGGMATVFEALHVESGRRVALKRVKDAGRGDKQFTDRFLREVQAASRLDHPHVCKVLAGGRAGDELFMAVELLEGGDLDRLLKRMGGKLPAAAAAVVVCELLEALAYAHEQGVVHRDIKPANVMLAGDGAVKLVDFGIARAQGDQKLTATGLVVGTPAYMSPEQARGMDTDGRSDLFSVGVLLVELVTGDNPFFAESSTATVMKILMEPAPPLFALDPSAPGVLHHVAGALLERDRERRYRSARAALEDLAPYRALVTAQHPQLLRECLADPERMAAVLRAEQAQFERDRAADLLELGEPGLPAATLALVRALQLEPGNADARRMLADVVRRASFDLTPADPRLRGLEEELARAGGNSSAATWRRAADLHRAAKNPPGQARCLAYYLQRQPTDELAARQFRSIASGPDVDAAGGGAGKRATRVALSTREIVDGIRTGGMKAAARTEGFTAARPAVGSDDPFATAMRAGGATPSLSGSSGLDTATRAQQRAPAGRAGAGNIVVVAGGAHPGGRERGGSGTWVMAAALVALVVLAFAVFSWSTREGAKQTEKALVAATQAVDVEERAREDTQRLLDRAREALARGAATDAIGLADQAMRFQPSMSEQADALFVKARARVAEDDHLRASSDLRRYFDTAPPSHRDMHDARQLAREVDARLNGGGR